MLPPSALMAQAAALTAGSPAQMALMQQVQIALVQTANVSSQQRAAVMLEQASVLPAGSQEQVAVLKQVQVMRSEAPAPSKAAAMMLELATFPAGKQRQQQQMLAMEQMHKEVQAQTESSLKLTKAEGSMPTRSHAVEEREQTSDAATMPPLPSLPPPDITFRDSESARGRTAMLSSDHPEKSILEKLGAIHAVVSSEKQKSYAAAAEQEARRIAELRAQAEVDMFRLAQLRGMEEQFRALPTSSAAESKQTTSMSVDAMLELSMTELAQRSLAEVEEGQRLALLRETTMRETTQLNALRERTVAEASRLIAMQESTAAVVAAAAAVRQSSSTLTPTASPSSSPPIRVAEVIVTGGSIVNLGAELEAALGLSMFPASRIFRTLRRFCNGRDPRLTGRVFMMAMHEASNLDPARPSPPAVRALAKLFRAIDIDRVGLVNILSVAGALVAVIPTAIVEQSSSSSPSSSSTECLTNMPESVLSAVLELADTRGDGTVSSDAMALFLTSVLTIKMMLNGHNPQRAYAVARETLDGETRLPRSFLSQHDFRRWFRDQIVSPQRRQIAMAQEEEPRRRSPWLKASQKSQLKKGQGQMGGRLKTNADSGGEPSLAASSPPHLSKQTALSRSTMMMGTTICTPLDEQCARYDAKSANIYAGLENGIPMRSVQRSQFRSSSSTMSIVGSAAACGWFAWGWRGDASGVTLRDRLCTPGGASPSLSSRNSPSSSEGGGFATESHTPCFGASARAGGAEGAASENVPNSASCCCCSSWTWPCRSWCEVCASGSIAACPLRFSAKTSAPRSGESVRWSLRRRCWLDDSASTTGGAEEEEATRPSSHALTISFTSPRRPSSNFGGSGENVAPRCSAGGLSQWVTPDRVSW